MRHSSLRLLQHLAQSEQAALGLDVPTDGTLEDYFAAERFCGLTTASDLQRAVCRAADGLPTGLDPEACMVHFGVDKLPDIRPRVVTIVAGVRGGKSRLAGTAALHAALTADLSTIQAHEVARFPIVAPTVDAATATYTLIVGMARSSPVLSRYVDGDPTASTLRILRPDGRRVEIVVVAAHRGGLSVRNRWLVGFVLDEVAQFGVQAMGAQVNAEELLQAAETRLLPKCQGWIISSPYGPSGLLYELWQAFYGSPSAERLVIHAPTRAFNPSFEQSKIEAIRAVSPDVAAREYDATWLEADTAFYPEQHLEAAIRHEPVVLPPTSPYEGTWHHAAAMDPASRGNAWALIVHRLEPAEGGPRHVVVRAEQWVGSRTEPLSPEAVMGEIADICHLYGVRLVITDVHMFDALQNIASRLDLVLEMAPSTGPANLRRHETVAALLADGKLELPDEPDLIGDMRQVRKIALAGGMRVDLDAPNPAGRHCDYAAAVALAISYPPVLSSPVEVEPARDEVLDEIMDELREKERRQRRRMPRRGFR